MSQTDSDPDLPAEPLDEVEASRAPLMDHLIELRRRLIISFASVAIGFVLCFFVSTQIYNILLVLYERAAGEAQDIELIYTQPLGFFFVKIKLALFGALILSFPVIATQLYLFIAPGLYKNERHAFLPFLAAKPILFLAGASIVYFGVLPSIMRFALGFEQGGDAGPSIQLLADVNDYLSLVTTLIIAFGLSFQLPVLLTLLARAGLLSAQTLAKNRRYAIVGVFAFAAFATPPDIVSQISLGLAVMGLYEISVLLVRAMEKKAAADAQEEPA